MLLLNEYQLLRQMMPIEFKRIVNFESIHFQIGLKMIASASFLLNFIFVPFTVSPPSRGPEDHHLHQRHS